MFYDPLIMAHDKCFHKRSTKMKWFLSHTNYFESLNPIGCHEYISINS